MPDQTPHTDPSPNTDLAQYRLHQVEELVHDIANRVTELEKWPDRVKLIGALIIFASPLAWKVVDKIWP